MAFSKTRECLRFSVIIIQSQYRNRLEPLLPHLIADDHTSTILGYRTTSSDKEWIIPLVLNALNKYFF